MLQIKTIRIYDAEAFDRLVNEAIEDGWKLNRRTLDNDCYLIAELERDVIAELERDVITEKERCCKNCKHYKKGVTEEPCLNCYDNDKWEPIDA